MWNLALDGSGNPKLPGTDSCGGQGCRPVVTVNSDGSYSLNQECTLRLFSFVLKDDCFTCLVWSMAQASKAIIPKDSGGPFGQRIGVSVTGSLNKALLVGAYVINRVNPIDLKQYSLVVFNRESISC